MVVLELALWLAAAGISPCATTNTRVRWPANPPAGDAARYDPIRHWGAPVVPGEMADANRKTQLLTGADRQALAGTGPLGNTQADVAALTTCGDFSITSWWPSIWQLLPCPVKVDSALAATGIDARFQTRPGRAGHRRVFLAARFAIRPRLESSPTTRTPRNPDMDSLTVAMG